MIVTRRRRKAFPWKRYAFPAAAIVLLIAAFAWTPSRTWIATGPLAPVWRAVQPAANTVAKPFDAAGQMRTISGLNGQIASLQKQLADARAQVSDRDKQISNLQSQLNSAQQDAAMAKAAKPSHATVTQQTAGAASAEAAGSDLAAQATPDMRRTAAVWAAMDSEAAAKVVQKLPDDYVVRIFAIMPPDSVGAILENLPAAYAARLTRDRPELSR